MEPTIRQYFGFLFTYRGRASFLFLCVYYTVPITSTSHVTGLTCGNVYLRADSVGFMNFGMNGSFSKFVGVLMCANAFFELLIINCHPEFKNGHLSSTMDPTASYMGASDVSELFAIDFIYASLNEWLTVLDVYYSYLFNLLL